MKKIFCLYLSFLLTQTGTQLAIDQIDERVISDHLYTAGIIDPDLLIRTAGEMRISNYLL